MHACLPWSRLALDSSFLFAQIFDIGREGILLYCTVIFLFESYLSLGVILWVKYISKV